MARALVDVDRARAKHFGLAEDLGPFDGDAHVHQKHQLLFAASGSMTLHVGDRRWLLPPERCAWIRAGETHRVSSATGIELRTVYLSPADVPDMPLDARVFSVCTLAREMLLYAMRWGPDDGPDNGIGEATRASFFRAIAGLSLEWMAEQRPYFLPTPSSEELGRAIRYIEEHLENASVGGAAAASHLSVRTLTRRFELETRMTFRNYLRRTRMLRAMELLLDPCRSITRVACEVGFSSPGAFAEAFQEVSGESPSQYRRRVTTRA